MLPRLMSEVTASLVLRVTTRLRTARQLDPKHLQSSAGLFPEYSPFSST